MTKTKKTIMIAVVSVLVLALGSAAAYAATNISEIEDLFLAFRTAQTQEAVADGSMTQDEADEYLDNLTTRMEEDEDDAVPPLKGNGGNWGGKGMMGRDTIALFADVSGMTADEIQDALQDGETTIFALADSQGLLDDLKAAMLEDTTAKIDEMVQDGKLDQDRADEMKVNAEETIEAITADTEMGGRMTRGQRQGGFDKEDMPEKPFGNRL